MHITLFLYYGKFIILFASWYNTTISDWLKCAILRFYVVSLPKILDFCYFVLIWCKLLKKILKQSCKDLCIWTELPIVWLIIGSDNIFNIEVNEALAINRSCAQLANAKSEWAKILDLKILNADIYLLMAWQSRDQSCMVVRIQQIDFHLI